MTAGGPAGPRNDEPLLPPDDTGEAIGHLPSRLTITFGFGPGLFERDGVDRFGLAAQRPPELRQLPPLPAEAIDPAISGGDLCVQACSDDPQVAFHAVRNLARIGRGSVVMRWSQLGFGRTSTTTREQDTPRNLMGLKDGTNNIRAEDTEALERVRLGRRGGAGVAARAAPTSSRRRIRMLIESWDRTALVEQERTIGRHKYSGAPLGGERRVRHPRLRRARARRPGDRPRRPHPAQLRRPARRPGSSAAATRSPTASTRSPAQLDAGLFFICFQRDPAQFERIQRNLSGDILNEYIVHTSSAVFAVPPGASEGGFVGQGLFA